MKTRLLAGLVVGCALVLCVLSSAAADKLADAVKKKLTTSVTMKGDTGNTPLKDALEYLGERHDLTITIDRLAFAKAGLSEVELAPIKFVEQKNVPLGKVLQRLLDQIPASYKIEGGGVIVIPRRMVKT